MSDSGASSQPPLVSIIVPVYNVADYLEDCLDSLLGQQLAGDCEIILVEDCSGDSSRAICRRYADSHPERVSLVEQAQNAGVSVARNRGLEQARGRYLTFVDGDDRLPPGALATLCAAAEEQGADIVKGNLVLFDVRRRRPAPDRVRRDTLLRGEAVLTALFEHSQVRGHAGGKLFRRDRFGQLRFASGVRMTEDLLYFSEMFAAADTLLLLEAETYEYRKHEEGSTGGKYSSGAYVDWLDAVEACGRFAATARQRRAHKGLLLRSLTQIARECRKIDVAGAAPVLDLIEARCRRWRLQAWRILLGDRLGLRGLSRYIKLRRAVSEIRRNLSRA